MYSEQGFLGHLSLGSQRAVVPAYVHLEGDRLLWDYDHPTDPTEHGREADPKGMLDAFVRVQDGASALRFALRYGVLGICEHGLPATHNPPPLTGRSSAYTWCYPLGWPDHCWEPLDSWLHYAGQARAMIAIAANLRQNKPGSVDDWRAVFAGNPDQNIDALCQRLGRSVELGRLYLRSVLLEWLTWGNVRPELDWPITQESPSLSFTGATFGVLAVQLLFAITISHSIAVCDGCGTPYLRTRKRSKKRNFCEDCGEAVASKLRQRDWLRHKKEKEAQDGSQE